MNTSHKSAGPISSIINAEKFFSGGRTFHSVSPSNTDDIIGTFGIADSDECRKACLAARAAAKDWRNTPAPIRGGVIANFGNIIASNKEALSVLVSREMGKPLREARGDVQEAIDTAHFFMGEGRRLYGQTLPSEMKNKELFTYRRPIGVFACITAGNFPIAVPSWYFIPALLCGNTCVWKPSEDTPMLSLIFAEMLLASGVPKGVFNVVFGDGPGAGASLLKLVDEGLIDKVGFTGSSEVGKGIGEICGRNLQNPCLELGGKNPMVIEPDADLDLATEGIVWSGFGTAGQRCTSLGNLIVHESIKDKLMQKVMAAMEKVIIGDPMDESITYGPMISKKFYDTHLRNLAELVQPHHRLLTKVNGAIQAGAAGFKGNASKGLYVHPTIVDNVTKNDAIYHTETFGPLFNVMTYKNLDEAIDLANGTGFGLSSSIYTQSMQSAYTFRTEIVAGMTSINNGTSGAEAHMPFGGNGKSGNGSRQSGIWVLDQFTKWQSVNWDMSGKLQLAQMDTGYISATAYKMPAY